MRDITLSLPDFSKPNAYSVFADGKYIGRIVKHEFWHQIEHEFAASWEAFQGGKLAHISASRDEAIRRLVAGVA